MTPNIGDGQVTLTWRAVATAACYDLRMAASIDRQWGAISGVLTATTNIHSAQTDGRDYMLPNGSARGTATAHAAHGGSACARR